MGEVNVPKGKLCFSALVATRPEVPGAQEVGESDSLPGEALAELSSITHSVMAFCTDKWCNRDILGERGKGFEVFLSVDHLENKFSYKSAEFKHPKP